MYMHIDKKGPNKKEKEDICWPACFFSDMSCFWTKAFVSVSVSISMWLQYVRNITFK